jgi:hypothetical protein
MDRQPAHYRGWQLLMDLRRKEDEIKDAGDRPNAIA